MTSKLDVILHMYTATLYSRNLKDATKQYPAITRAVTALHATNAILDGELVAVDANGGLRFRPCTSRPHIRSRTASSTCCT